jgi:hypothetical protein
MVASIFILAVSVALLIYWFRYCCLILLRNYAEQQSPVPENRFSFPQVRERLQTDSDLDTLQLSLDRDYRVVTYLLQHAAGLGDQSIEHRLLRLDYMLMRMRFVITKTAAPEQARKALSEQVAILGCLARKMGEQAGLHSEA